MNRIQALAYLVVESTEPSRWKDYGTNVLGMQAVDAADGALLKMDEREFRVLVRRGNTDRYYASGWEVSEPARFEETLAALAAAGMQVERGDAALRASRKVKDIASFVDPSGNRHEIVHGYTGAIAPFASPIGVAGFKTGIYGLGHTVLPAAQNFDATLALFRNALGFGVSDVFDFQPGPDAPVIRIHFLHGASGRHHSVALAEMPNPSGCVHVMVEVGSMTDVGLAHDRMLKTGVKEMATLGQHENDKMTSFYMQTPGGFAIEYGWNGIIVDPATWQPTRTRQVSIWGHDFSVGFR